MLRKRAVSIIFPLLGLIISASLVAAFSAVVQRGDGGTGPDNHRTTWENSLASKPWQSLTTCKHLAWKRISTRVFPLVDRDRESRRQLYNAYGHRR